MTEQRRKPKFLRTHARKHAKLHGTGWRRAKGRHNKIREKRKGHPRAPGIGYGMPRDIRGLIQGMTPRLVQNVSDLSLVGKNEIAVIATQLGAKKRVQIAEQALKLNVKTENFNAQKFLDGMKKKMEGNNKTSPAPATSTPSAKNEEKKENKKENKN